MQKPNRKGVLDVYDFLFFDFDGVVLDSMNIKTEAFREMYVCHGEDIADKVVKHHTIHGGMSRFLKFRHYHGEFLGVSLTDDEVNKMAQEFAERVYEKVIEAAFIPGVKEFLDRAKELDKTCFIVTGTPEEEMCMILNDRDLAHYFSEVHGAPQSKEDAIAELINRYDIRLEKAVMFGDAINDKLGADYNKIDFIGINYSDAERWYKNFLPLLEKDGVV